MVSVANEFEAGAEAFGALMALKRPPTAVVAATDVLAVGALRGAYDRGLAVPHDVSVTGFDDIPFASMSVPGLTTIRMPVREMVEQAMRVAIDEPSDGAAEVVPHSMLTPELVARGSSGPPSPDDRGS
jgi:LacI family transcriptional regulator